MSVLGSCMPESTDDALHPLTCYMHLTSRILFTIASFPLYSLTVLYWDDPHAGDCGISAQLLAVDLVKQDVGTFFSCTVHASPATCLIDPFTHISKEFTLFGKVSLSSVLTSVSRILFTQKTQNQLYLEN